MTEQSGSLKLNLKAICSFEVFLSLINKINITNEKLEQQLLSRKDHKAKAQNNKCPSNSTPIEIYDLVEKHTRINRRKREKNRRYLKQSDYENKQNKKYDRYNDYKYVVNLSSVNLNETEIKLLSKGLSFCPTPHKIDWIELKTDLSDFARRLRLKEYFYGRESSEYYNPEDDNPFKRKSTWTPDKNREPALDLFIHLITKDILNTKPLKIADNLTKQEREALENLTERNDIVIKPADKGKATVIMDTEKYKAECFRQLNNPKFYKQLPKDITHQVEDRIHIRLKRLLIDDEIEEDTYTYLVPHRSRPARFYILPKIHKNKDNPPGRPIVSASSHPTERISEFVDYQLNPLVPKLPSYIKDTTHFLQKLDSLPELPNGCLLVTLDVSSLYTNIPHKEGIHACRKALESRTNTRLKTESICDLIRMILTMNNFEFENNYYLQLHGTAMGTKMAPAYANLFMGDLEQKLSAQSPLKPLVWWRYIDDIFMIWPHGEEKLNEFVNLLNSSHETIKFTHEVSPSKINFLDVTVLLHNNNITTDLHVKSTDTHQYLLSSSCHPNHIKKSIPYSLALRIRRICSTDDNFKQRTNELLEFLCQRGHKRDYVKIQINKAFNVPRKNTLYYQHKKSNDRTVFVTTYNPSLPNFNNIIKKYYPILTASDRCKNAFTVLEIHLFLPTAALATFAIPSYVLKLKHLKLHILLHQK